MNVSYQYLILVLLLCLLSVPLVLLSQVQQPNRFEKERKFSDEDFIVLPMKEEGLALIREQNKYKSGNQTWEIILLDTALQEKGVLEPEIDNENKLIGYEYSPGFIHFLFNKNEIKGELEILSIEIKTREIFRHEIKSELKFQLTHFIKVAENFILGGYVGLEPAVLLYTPVTKNLKVLPGFFQKDTELIDVRSNQNETFNTLFIDRGDRKARKIILRTFDSSGKILFEDLTDIEEEITLQNGISSTLEREDLVIVGTWSRHTAKQASGFYFLPVNPFSEQKISRVYFGQLTHYLDYLKPKKASNIKTKTLQALEDGKIPEFTNYVTTFKIIEHSKGFLALAESYIPTNSSNYNFYSPYSHYPYSSSQETYSPYGRINSPPNSNSSSVNNSEEIKNIQSVVIAFDATGQILWDYSIKLTDMKRSSLEQVTDFHLQDDRVHFLYKKDSDLKIKIINLSDNDSVESTEKIRLNDPQDELRSEDSHEGSVKHWFGRSFYVWGNQSIRNRTSLGEKTREVFYINKVVVH